MQVQAARAWAQYQGYGITARECWKCIHTSSATASAPPALLLAAAGPAAALLCLDFFLGGTTLITAAPNHHCWALSDLGPSLLLCCAACHGC